MILTLYWFVDPQPIRRQSGTVPQALLTFLLLHWKGQSDVFLQSSVRKVVVSRRRDPPRSLWGLTWAVANDNSSGRRNTSVVPYSEGTSWGYGVYTETWLGFTSTVGPEKAMAPHSSTLAWKIPWTEEPGGLRSMGSLRVRHNWVTSLWLFTFMNCRRKWQPTPVFLPGESQGWRGAWWAAVYGVAQSRTRLKWFSSSSGGSAGTSPWFILWLLSQFPYV